MEKYNAIHKKRDFSMINPLHSEIINYQTQASTYLQVEVFFTTAHVPVDRMAHKFI